MSGLIWIPLALICCAGVLVLPVIPRGLLLLGLLVARSLSDIGAASTGSLIPSSLISTGLGAVAIVASLLPSRTKLSDHQMRVILVILSVLLISTGITYAHFGSILGAVGEPIRIASLLAIYVIAYKYADLFQEKAIALLGIVSLPAALLLIGGFLVGAPALISSGERAVGTFSHPNSAAAFFSIGALVAIGIAVSKRSKGWGALGILNVVALLLTKSLGGLLGFVVGGLVFILLRSSITRLRKTMLVVGLCVATLGIVAFSGISERLDELNGLDVSGSLASGTSTNSLEWRLINWGEYLVVFSTSPIFGTGVGTTYGEIMPLGGPPHSLFIQFLVEFGVVGVGIFAVLVISMFLFLAKHLTVHWSPGLILAVSTLMLVNGSESNLFGYTAAMYYIAAIYGILGSALDKTLDGLRHANTASKFEMRRISS